MCTRTRMATKTLTITEDAYNLLKGRKLENESFSQEITRLLTEKKKKNLVDFFGILTKEEGKGMKEFFEKRREINWELKKKRFKQLQ
jgi:predicted CopG family antitoxin